MLLAAIDELNVRWSCVRAHAGALRPRCRRKCTGHVPPVPRREGGMRWQFHVVHSGARNGHARHEPNGRALQKDARAHCIRYNRALPEGAPYGGRRGIPSDDYWEAEGRMPSRERFIALESFVRSIPTHERGAKRPRVADRRLSEAAGRARSW